MDGSRRGRGRDIRLGLIGRIEGEKIDEHANAEGREGERIHLPGIEEEGGREGGNPLVSDRWIA